jgi:serine/threonine protein kinase
MADSAVALAGRGAFRRVLGVLDVRAASRARSDSATGAYGRRCWTVRQLARLRHPLPRVFEVGRTREVVDDIPAGAAFFVAEWIAGTRCDARAWQPGDGAALWSLLADLAGALATIHAAGLVHADVAPQNVLVTDERAVLVDLGLAAALDVGDARAGVHGSQARRYVEPRSGLYGLGAIAVRLVPVATVRGGEPGRARAADRRRSPRHAALPSVPRALII